MVGKDILDKTYNKKKVFVTGHTGFKGAWFIQVLAHFGAIVKGYALEQTKKEGIYHVIGGDSICDSVIADVRDKDRLKKEVLHFQPDLIFHLAAQPLVGLSYEDPLNTVETNVNGTVNLLNAIRGLETKCSVVCITTDKVYENQGWVHSYRENDTLGGVDPYSASKAASELLISSFRNSFFPVNEYQNHQKAIAVARAGNVIGGGDWSKNRIFPDIFRAQQCNEPVILRNPASVRPWQHVMDALNGYLLLGALLHDQPQNYSEAWNFGPYSHERINVIELVQIAHEMIGKGEIVVDETDSFYESSLLMLDISKSLHLLGWKPKWDASRSISETVKWYMNPTKDFTTAQICDFYDF